MDPKERPRLHARDHLPGGADPLAIDLSLYGQGDLTLAIRDPGSLLAWYRFNYTDEGPTGDALDSSGNGRTLTYTENTAAVGEGAESWDSSHEAIRSSGQHPELGDADDGNVLFQYDQPGVPGGDEGTWDDTTYPGAYFHRSDSTLTVPANWKTILGFVRIPEGGNTVIAQTIVGARSWNTVELGTQGWAVQYNSNTGKIDFAGGAFGPGSMVAPGALLPGVWYMWSVVRDTDASLWRLYLNAVQTNTLAFGGSIASASTLTLGNDRGTYGNFPEGSKADAFFYGDMDEVAFYNAILTPAQLGAIWAARGAGTGFGPTETIVTAGGGADPFHVASTTPSGDAAEFTVMEADGAAGTRFAYPKTRVYLNGADPA